MPAHLSRPVKIGLSLIPLLLIIGVSLLESIPYARNHPWAPTQLLDADSRREGIFIYGWSDRHVYSSYGTFPSHPDLTMKIAISWMNKRKIPNLENLLQDPRKQPITIVDLVAVGKGRIMYNAPSIQELARRPDGRWLKQYTLVSRSPEGWVYRRIKTHPIM